MLVRSRLNHVALIAFLTSLTLLAATPAQAIVVVNNLGEEETGVAAIFGSDPSLATATQFTTGAGDWRVNTITARLYDSVGLNPDAMELQVRNDDGGNPGASILGVLNMSLNNIIEGSYTYEPVSDLFLMGGTSYWLVGLPTFLDAQHGWGVTPSANDNGILGWSIGNLNRSSGDLGATWIPNGDEPGKFSIDASVVPEPGTLSLAAFAIGILGLCARRRRTAVA